MQLLGPPLSNNEGTNFKGSQVDRGLYDVAVGGFLAGLNHAVENNLVSKDDAVSMIEACQKCAGSTEVIMDIKQLPAESQVVAMTTVDLLNLEISECLSRAYFIRPATIL